MALLGQITVDELAIISVDVDPSVSGIDAPIGSMAMLDDNANGRLWVKSGAGTTAWSIIPRLASGTSFSPGAVIFADSNGFLSSNTSRLYWDNTNGRLGIGLAAPATPQSTVHIDRGTGVGGHVRFTAGTTTGQTAGDGFEIGIDDTGAAELLQRENSAMNFMTNGIRYLQINPAGKVIIGAGANAADITGTGTIPAFQIIDTTAFAAQMAAISFTNDTSPSIFNLAKSRGAVNTHVIVQNNDEIGRVQYRASDGVAFQAAASVRAAVDGVPGVGSMPGRLIFMTTPSGSVAPVERARITSTGLMILAQGLRVGAETDSTGGNIRYVSDTDIQGYVGGAYRSLVNVPNFQATATGSTTTTSASDVLMDSMTVTPGAGTYMAMFSTTLQSSSAGAQIFVSIYANGVQVSHSQRQAQPRVDASGGLGGNGNLTIDTPIYTQATVTVAAAQAIEVRWRRTAGTATALQRNLILVKVNI